MSGNLFPIASVLFFSRGIAQHSFFSCIRKLPHAFPLHGYRTKTLTPGQDILTSVMLLQSDAFIIFNLVMISWVVLFKHQEWRKNLLPLSLPVYACGIRPLASSVDHTRPARRSLTVEVNWIWQKLSDCRGAPITRAARHQTDISKISHNGLFADHLHNLLLCLTDCNFHCFSFQVLVWDQTLKIGPKVTRGLSKVTAIFL